MSRSRGRGSGKPVEQGRKESRLTHLYKRKAELEEQIDKKVKLIAAVTEDLQVRQKKLDNVNKGIAGINSQGLRISTHALDRYIQRIDAQGTEESMRARVCTPEIEKIVRTLGGGLIPVDDFYVKIIDNKIITCFKDKDDEQ